MHSWNRSCTGCTPRPASVPAARYSMHWTGQNSGHLPHGKQRFTSMNATSRGRFFFSLISSGKGASGMRSSFRRRLMMSIADMRASYARVPWTSAASHRAPVTGGGALSREPSAREPVDQREDEADEPAHDGTVQPDELEIGADAVLDLAHELVVAEPLETLAHRETDLRMVASEEVARGRAHPAVEGAAAAGVREEIEDAGAQLAVDERRERAPPVGQVLLELLAQAREHGADDGARLDALEERAAQPLGLRLRGGVAGGEPLGEATERCQHGSAEGMLRVARRAAQLRGGIVAGRLDDRALHHLAAEHEGQEPLAGSVQCPGGAIEPPVQLGGRPRPGREVGERKCEALERRAGAFARHRARQPRPGRGIEGQLAELSLRDAVDEAHHLLLGEDS